MKIEGINLEEKFSQFDELWSPRIIAQMNDYHFKLTKIQGDRQLKFKTDQSVPYNYQIPISDYY